MLKEIRVLKVGPLPQVDLHDLGRINVICGKNNSGKTTLLNSLGTSDHRSAGASISIDDARQLATEAAEATMFRRGSGHDVERSIYTEWITMFLQSRPVWYTSDRDDINRILAAGVEQNTHLKRYQVNVGFVAQALATQIGPFPSSVLIPPKRRLQLHRAITTSETVEPSGDGLLNFLFFAKNQAAATDDRRAYDGILEAFEQISAGFLFDVFADRANNIALSFARRGEQWVSAGACGLGLQDLLILLYFVLVAPHQLLLIEEPESHMHPDMQRRFLAFVRNRTDKQLFVTTHSNVFLNNAFVDRVFFTTFEDAIRVDDATSRASILDDLGYAITDNLVSDLVVLVEGPSDVPVIEELLLKEDLSSKYEIKIWPLGGDIMDQLDLSVFAEKYRILAVVDRDPDSDAVRRRFERKCKESGIQVLRLARYSIENYFTLDALREVFGAQVPGHITELDPDAKLAKQIGFDVKKRNRDLARAMKLADFQATDLAKFVSTVRKLLGA